MKWWNGHSTWKRAVADAADGTAIAPRTIRKMTMVGRRKAVLATIRGRIQLLVTSSRVNRNESSIG